MNFKRKFLFSLILLVNINQVFTKNETLLDLNISNTQEKKENKTTTKNELYEKLEKYNLIAHNQPFTYSYKTEVYSPTLEKSFNLDPQIEGFAKAHNLRLNQSIFFDPEFIVQSKNVRKYQLKPKHFKHNVGRLLTVPTRDNKTVPCTFFNRNCKKLLVVGEGFTNDREVMSPFIDMFPGYDVVFFDYRGQGFKPEKPNFSLTKTLFGADCNKVMLGAKEENDVFAVVDFFKENKSYKEINGIGICYSALIFAKAAAIRQKTYGVRLFDHLILDGCWFSLENFVEKLAKDPKRICSPQYGGWKETWPVKMLWFQKMAMALGQELFHTKFNQVSILDYLPEIKNLPILIFYGKDDLVINRHEFELIWNAIKITEKTAIVTSNPHVRNHLKEKELYTLICDLFLELPHDKFISCLKDKDYLLNYQANKLATYTNTKYPNQLLGLPQHYYIPE